MTYTVQTGTAYFGGKQLTPYHATTTASRSALSWNDVTSVADIEILALIRKNSTAGVDYTGVVARGSGADGTETGIFLWLMDDTTDGISLTRYNGGVMATIADSTFNWKEGTWYWARLRVIGSTAYGRIWKYGNSEPGTWAVSGSVGTVTSAGWSGVADYSNEGSHTYNARFDWFGIASNGGTVTMPTTPLLQW
jgi:hypothetical protein